MFGGKDLDVNVRKAITSSEDEAVTEESQNLIKGKSAQDLQREKQLLNTFTISTRVHRLNYLVSTRCVSHCVVCREQPMMLSRLMKLQACF